MGDYDASDASLLFELIDANGNGTMTVDELTTGMAALKGGARNIDMKLLLRQSQLGIVQRRFSLSQPGQTLKTSDALRLVEGSQVENSIVFRILDSVPPSPSNSRREGQGKQSRES